MTACAPGPPPVAAEVFGERLPLARQFADLLCSEAVVRGLIGPRESARIWPRHLLNGAVLAELVPADARVVDLGSGAGLPGIPLALARPDLEVTLVEPLARRVVFLEQTVAALGIAVRIVRDCAENLAGYEADVVVARAVAPLVRLAPLAMPLVRPRGRLLAVKGVSAAAELADAQEALRQAGVVDAQVMHIDVSGIEPLTVIRCVAGGNPVTSQRAGHRPVR